MSNQIKINTSSLNRDAGQVDAYIRKIRTEMGRMKSNVEAMDKMWDGPGSEAFKKAFQDDMKDLETIIKNLEQVHTYEVNAKKKYESCESKVHELVSGIRI